MSSIRTRSSAPLCLKAGFRHALKSGMILLSQPTFEEIDEVLAREKFDDYLTLEERAAFIEALVERSRFANPTEEVQACRDPDDDKFLELAVSESAECIVSGDADLLVLRGYLKISCWRRFALPWSGWKRCKSSPHYCECTARNLC